MASIAARKKLSALYARGVMIRFTPEGPRFADPAVNRGNFPEDDKPGEDDVEMWIAPPNPHQKEMALRDAQAARARGLLKVKNNPESEEYLTVRAYLAEMSFETLIDYLVIADAQDRANEAMRQVLGEKEWENFDELRDSMRQYEEAVAHFEETGEGEDPRESEEWRPLLETEIKYANQVDAKDNDMADAARASMALIGRDELEKRAADKRGEIVGSQAFMGEYEDQMRFYAVRDAGNHNELFYENVRQLREDDETVQLAIGEGLRLFITDGAEAKN